MGIAYGVTTNFQATKGIVQDGLVFNFDTAVAGVGSSLKSLVGDESFSFLNGASIQKTVTGPVVVLDGSNDSIEISDVDGNYLFDSNATIEAWVKITARLPQANRTRIFAKRRHPNTLSCDYWSLAVIGNGLNGSSPTISANGVQGADGTFTYDQWTHISATFPSAVTGTTTIYKNGESYTSGSSAGCSMQTSNQPLRFTSPSEAFLASIKVYNRILTAAEVSRNFNVMRHRFGI